MCVSRVSRDDDANADVCVARDVNVVVSPGLRAPLIILHYTTLHYITRCPQVFELLSLRANLYGITESLLDAIVALLDPLHTHPQVEVVVVVVSGVAARRFWSCAQCATREALSLSASATTWHDLTTRERRRPHRPTHGGTCMCSSSSQVVSGAALVVWKLCEQREFVVRLAQRHVHAKLLEVQ